MTDHSEIAAGSSDGLADIGIDAELWSRVLDAPGTAPQVARVRGLAQAPSTLAISGPRGVGKRALASLVHGWSERPGEFAVVECARLVARRDPSLARTDVLVDEWFRAAEGGTLVVVNPGLLDRELQLALASRIPSVRGASLDRWSEPPRVPTGFRSEARVILLLEAGGLDWLDLDLRHRVAQHTELPPLEAHAADVAVVVRTLLDVLAGRDGAGPLRVTADGVEYLQRCTWPTQVAGLMRTVMSARAAALRYAPGGHEVELDRSALAAAHASGLLRPAAIVVEDALDASYREAKESVIEQFEGLFFARVLERTHGNVSEAARQTGLDRSNFRRALRRARERAGSSHPERHSSSPAAEPGSTRHGFGEAGVDPSRRNDSSTHRIESGVRWQAADSDTNGDGSLRAPAGTLESGEMARPGVASARPDSARPDSARPDSARVDGDRADSAPPARLHGTLPRR